MSPRLSVWVIGVAAAGVLLQPGFSQARGGTTGGTAGGTTAPPTGTGGTTGGNTTGRTPGTIPTTPAPGTTTTTTPTQRPGVLFVTGRVVLEEGGPPPDSAVIERVCNGSSRAEGYTDSKGNFSVQIGDESGVFQDASETSNYGGSLGGIPGSGRGPATGMSGGAMGDQRYANCDLRAKLVGFRSQTVSLANRRPLDDPNIGVILLHREGKDEGSTISAVSLAAPRDAHKAFEKGLQLLKKGKTDEAEKEYRKAVALYPAYADAWNEIGRIELGRGLRDEARQSFEKAVKADPKYVQPLLQLSLINMEEKKWRELADITDQALKLDPFDYARAWLYNGVAYWNLKKVDTAEKSIRQAERLDGQHTLPDVSRLLGVILAYRQDYAGALDYFHQYLKLDPAAEDADRVRAQIAQAEKLKAQSAATATAKQDQ